MTRADKAALRVTLGLGAATLLAYGLALQMPFVVCVMATIVLSRPGPPLPLAKGAVLAIMFGGLLTAGVLMVPVLEHYAFTGLLLTATILFAVFYVGLRRRHPLTTVLLLAFVLIPVAGVADQALIGALSLTLAVGIVVGTLVNATSHAFFPDEPANGGTKAPQRHVTHSTAAWISLRGTLIVMPVFVLALTNPSLYLAAIMKTVTLGQQASQATARDAGKELVGSTLVGAVIGAAVWLGLSLWPGLWMLTLWLMAAALWCASAMFGVRRTTTAPSFWANALITALILLGPAIEDSASGKSVLQASIVRTCLFVAVALYAWVTVWALEQWRTSRRRRSSPPPRAHLEEAAP
jgi:hypothetical protein